MATQCKFCNDFCNLDKEGKMNPDTALTKIIWSIPRDEKECVHSISVPFKVLEDLVKLCIFYNPNCSLDKIEEEVIYLGHKIIMSDDNKFHINYNTRKLFQ